MKIDSSIFAWTALQGHIWTENGFEDTKITSASIPFESQSVFGNSKDNKIETGAGADFLSGGGGNDILLSAGGHVLGLQMHIIPCKICHCFAAKVIRNKA